MANTGMIPANYTKVVKARNTLREQISAQLFRSKKLGLVVVPSTIYSGGLR